MMEIISQIFMVLILTMAVYLAFSQNVLRSSVVFFLQTMAVGGLLLFMGADYLAMVLFIVGILGSGLVLLFSSVTLNRNTDKSFREDFSKRKFLLAGSVFIGTAWAVLLSWALLNNSFFREGLGQGRSITIVELGNQMFEHHAVVVEIIAALFLLLAIGAGFLLRNAKDTS